MSHTHAHPAQEAGNTRQPAQLDYPQHASPHSHDHDHEHGHDHPHVHEHAHPHDYAHPHDEDHAHEHDSLGGKLRHFFQPHSHDHSMYIRDAALANKRGIWAVKISLIGLLVTAVFQLFVVYSSGSVALLADTVHNFSDALTALPLWLAFTLARLPRNQRYTYGYGRAEDLAGVLIVLMIFASALTVFYESIQKLIHFRPMENIGWVAAAAVIGFLGNELVALLRIRTGRQIGSAALVADGLHARTDGMTSLAVLVGAIGAALGFPLLDPLIGFGVGVAILVIVWGAARQMWFHIMDATDPETVDQIQSTAQSVDGVMEVDGVNLRWVGHQQRGEMRIIVDCKLTTEESHRIAEAVRCQLFEQIPTLADISIHVDPCECNAAVDYHPSSYYMTPALTARE